MDQNITHYKSRAGRIECANDYDENNNPFGGYVEGPKFKFYWQAGPLNENESNGALIEDILTITINRLQFLQNSQFACRENAIALTHLETAALWLNKRRADRETRGVSGFNKK